jgi:hypothetical protein
MVGTLSSLFLLEWDAERRGVLRAARLRRVYDVVKQFFTTL